jgi:hypothetical protein
MEEQVVGTVEVQTVTPVHVMVHQDGTIEIPQRCELGPAEARALAGVLVEAAERVEGVFGPRLDAARRGEL